MLLGLCAACLVTVSVALLKSSSVKRSARPLRDAGLPAPQGSREVMTPLNRAIILAVEAHAGQTDKAGDPYILHPLRVMLRFTDPTERIVAVLHDVIEDSHYKLSDLADGFYAGHNLRA
jgi:(p)ppGpp synthase/HD superfamily hydrolase